MTMPKETQRRFKIDVFTPDTLPMARLAEYMSEFAKLLGEPDRVHFVDVERGSAVLRARIDEVAVPKVTRRLSEAAQGQGDPVALKALKDLDEMLANDNAIGQVLDDAGAEVITFAGRNRPKPLEYGPFREDGVLEGVVIKIGGKGESVPIWLQDSERTHRCGARRPLARRLAKYYDGGLLRVSGTGNWMRLDTGAWQMRSFEIKAFEILDDAPLADVIQRLQSVEGADWGEDPLAELEQLRGSERLQS
jgi:hypothetical protein